jgi:hypothetical protein
MTALKQKGEIPVPWAHFRSAAERRWIATLLGETRKLLDELR